MPLSQLADLICAEDLPASGDCIENTSASVVADAISEASYIIYRMSGGRVYGVREATVRPMVRRCAGITSCAEHCTVPTIKLGEDIRRIIWVMIDGSLLAPTAYTTIDHDKIIRTDGLKWPHCQDLTKDLSEEGSFGIRYSFGQDLDPVAKRAVVDTTLELIKLADPVAEDRRLPPNVRSASKSGLSLTMQDRNTMIRELGSYLESVNRFMALYNRDGEEQTYVYSPDTSPQLHARGRNG